MANKDLLTAAGIVGAAALVGLALRSGGRAEAAGVEAPTIGSINLPAFTAPTGPIAAPQAPALPSPALQLPTFHINLPAITNTVQIQDRAAAVLETAGGATVADRVVATLTDAATKVTGSGENNVLDAVMDRVKATETVTDAVAAVREKVAAFVPAFGFDGQDLGGSNLDVGGILDKLPTLGLPGGGFDDQDLGGFNLDVAGILDKLPTLGLLGGGFDDQDLGGFNLDVGGILDKLPTLGLLGGGFDDQDLGGFNLDVGGILDRLPTRLPAFLGSGDPFFSPTMPLANIELPGTGLFSGLITGSGGPPAYGVFGNYFTGLGQSPALVRAAAGVVVDKAQDWAFDRLKGSFGFGSFGFGS